MKRLQITTLLLLNIALLLITQAFAANSFTASNSVDNYVLSTDDEISVNVFNEPDLSISKLRIASNGTISMPLLGQVQVKGLNASEVENKLTALLLDGYLKKPKVTVNITEYRPFYINGEVKNPGSYPYKKGLTVEKAVTLAGGFTERASRKSISLSSEENKSKIKAVSLNEHIKPGDIITINESFF